MSDTALRAAAQAHLDAIEAHRAAKRRRSQIGAEEAHEQSTAALEATVLAAETDPTDPLLQDASEFASFALGEAEGAADNAGPGGYRTATYLHNAAMRRHSDAYVRLVTACVPRENRHPTVRGAR